MELIALDHVREDPGAGGGGGKDAVDGKFRGPSFIARMPTNWRVAVLLEE
jgi:hypothetical protein